MQHSFANGAVGNVELTEYERRALFVGIQRKRRKRGAQIVLSDADIDAIRYDGRTSVEIGKAYGVQGQRILAIKSLRLSKHVPLRDGRPPIPCAPVARFLKKADADTALADALKRAAAAEQGLAAALEKLAERERMTSGMADVARTIKDDILTAVAAVRIRPPAVITETVAVLPAGDPETSVTDDAAGNARHEVNQLLLTAAERSDFRGAVHALALGADPNCRRNVKDRWGWAWTPLQIACSGTQASGFIAYPVIEALLKAGANPDMGSITDHGFGDSRNRDTPLCMTYMHTEVTEVLLKFNADPNLRCRNGNAPLHYANIAQTKLLLAAGADPLIENKQGRTPLVGAGIGKSRLLMAAVETGKAQECRRVPPGGTAIIDPATEEWTEEDIVRWAFGEPRRPRPSHPDGGRHLSAVEFFLWGKKEPIRDTETIRDEMECVAAPVTPQPVSERMPEEPNREPHGTTDEPNPLSAVIASGAVQEVAVIRDVGQAVPVCIIPPQAAAGHIRRGRQSKFTDAQLAAIGRDTRSCARVARAYGISTAYVLQLRKRAVPTAAEAALSVMPAPAPTAVTTTPAAINIMPAPAPPATTPPAATPPTPSKAATPQGRRHSWSAADTETLVNLWQRVGSNALIGIIMQRSPSSIQTQASRIGLPEKAINDADHRRRWITAADTKLDAAIEANRRPDGLVPIIEVARSVGRSVDAVLARLTARHGEDAEILGRLHVDLEDVGDAAGTEPARKTATTAKAEPKPTATAPTAGQGKQRSCLRCRKPFWSRGAGNRICGTCARTNEEYACW